MKNIKQKSLSDLAKKEDYGDRKGYTQNFITSSVKLSLPDFAGVKNLFKASIKKGSDFEIPYYNFSVVLHKKRKFPLLAACNIDGKAFVDTARKNSWRDDPRAEKYSWGANLYEAKKSDFDKGHMVAREYPAWGAGHDAAFKADQDTFHYTNSVPQVHKLNGGIWRELEVNVLHNGAKGTKQRVNLFIGPVLDINDPVFITKVNNEDIQVPNLFWKVIVWNKKGKGLHAVGFVMSQENFLIKDGLVRKTKKIKAATTDDFFENITFKDKKTYQVPISFIEEITGINFSWKNVTFPYKENKAIEMKSTRSDKPGIAGVSRGVKRPKKIITNMVL